MTNDTSLIQAALDRRFARAGMPACPDGAWRIDAAHGPHGVRPQSKWRSRRVTYAAAVLALIAVGTASAQATNAARSEFERFMVPAFASTTPLVPLIHRADRLTLAQAQRRMPFAIVDPAGLPAHTRFLYAHVVSEAPDPRVALSYETHLDGTYYRVSIEEATVVDGPPVAHFNVQFLGHTIDWTLPKRRWKHGSVTMDLFDYHVPEHMNDRIERANTL